MTEHELKRIRYATEHYWTFSGLTWIPIFWMFPLMNWINVLIYRNNETVWVPITLWSLGLGALALGWWSLDRHQVRRFGRVEPSERSRRRRLRQNLVLGLVLTIAWAGAFFLPEPGAGLDFYWICLGLLLVGIWWGARLRADRSYLLLAGVGLIVLAFVLPRWLAPPGGLSGGMSSEVTLYLVVRSAVEVSTGLAVGLLDYRALVRATRPIDPGVPEEVLQGGEVV